MKSKLTIDFQGVDTPTGGNNFEPVIRAVVEDSDDVRDGLMKTFFQSLGGQSNWLRVDIQENTLYQGSTKNFVVISTVKPGELTETANIIKHRLSVPGKKDMEFLSKFSIGDEVMYLNWDAILNPEKKQEYRRGYIEGVSFTKNKISYDIKDVEMNSVQERLPSDYVKIF